MTSAYDPALTAPWPHVFPDDLAAAQRVLTSGQLNYWTGAEGRQFEEEFAQFVGARRAIALANGTVALELALMALGVGPGDEVIVPSRTFIATASSVVMRGARPVPVDVDPDSQNLTPETVAPHITSRTRAIIAVHLAGWPCRLPELRALADAERLWLIEDCAQSHGARVQGKSVGAWGHAAAFSFCQDKIMTTGGEGGMLVTDDEQLWERAWSYKDHGKNRTAAQQPAAGVGFRWLHDSFGTNWRLSEVQSALGRTALRKLPDWVEQRRRLAGVWTARLAELPALRIPQPGPQERHSYYKYYALVRPERLREGWDRDRLLHAIQQAGVPVFAGSCSEIYRERAFPEAWRPPQPWPVARALGERSLMFLVHPTLEPAQVAAAAERVAAIVTQATLPRFREAVDGAGRDAAA
jgi:dTDP-4-amino-4,6-dideoxygalactose transaminase